jgi:DNA polymerase elongation subunit (family B)
MIKNNFNEFILNNEKIIFVENEKELIKKFIKVILDYDPFILLGYEIQKSSSLFYLNIKLAISLKDHFI